MTYGVKELVAGLAEADGVVRTRAAGRLMTALVERPDAHRELLEALQVAMPPRPALVLGVTGAPGVGKSTLVDALVANVLRRLPELKIAIVAVDPTSPFTGGAVLGDRVRMMRLALEERVFIRSLATRGELGGVCRAVPGVLAAAKLWGADLAIVETVGVGQSEIEIARHADRTCVVMAPGLGDGVQWLKAGLMEVADVFIVNKSERDGADALVAQLTSAVALAARGLRRRLRANTSSAPLPKLPPIMAVSAELGRGIDALAEVFGLGGPLSLHTSSTTENATHAQS
ncbi:MAG: methylmalonyl Co-A mutase-associated GTPase MeaB [Pirellula sp.]|nr:methylmalonyl Co-A mutase-associated GTPase MeaB [Pirellula sp.]